MRTGVISFEVSSSLSDDEDQEVLLTRRLKSSFSVWQKKNIYVTRFSNECRKTQTETEVTE